MKLPRDTGGEDLARLLAKFGYRRIRQSGSHIRLASSSKGKPHHITIPLHKPLKVGTLSRILKDIAAYLETDLQRLINELFA